MNIYEDPRIINPLKRIDNLELRYLNLSEISQGGPEIGNFYINGQLIDGKFGGPFIFQKPYIYIPAFSKKMFSRGFVLARIDITTNAIEYKGKIEPLIFLNKIIDNKIYYYKDIEKKVEGVFEL